MGARQVVDEVGGGDDQPFKRPLVARDLATYKQLRSVMFVDAIPRLPSGKVLRRILRDDLMAAATPTASTATAGEA